MSIQMLVLRWQLLLVNKAKQLFFFFMITFQVSEVESAWIHLCWMVHSCWSTASQYPVQSVLVAAGW